MAATINWAQLGVGIPSKFAEKHEPVNMNTDAYVKAGDQINGMFDRWNREKAIGGLYSDQLAALRAKCQELNAKLRKLNDELAEAKSSDPQYQADQAQALAAYEDGGSMSGYKASQDYADLLGAVNSAEQMRNYNGYSNRAPVGYGVNVRM